MYLWMWTTGILSFLFSYSESFLWLIPWFRDNVIRDITVQWKALGALVGSWNMLVYGTAFYLMEKISGHTEKSRSPQTFFFYFLGLTNLLFNWGHHTYIVPASPVIKQTAFIISMTELLILGNIIYQWKSTLNEMKRNYHLLPFRFLAAADFWIFLNLALAISISVPALNYYTHGTYITVAHAMGATIGINSMILIAALSYFFLPGKLQRTDKLLSTGFVITNIALFFFWGSMLTVGIIKAMRVSPGKSERFFEIMKQAEPAMKVFSLSGFGLMAGLMLIILALIKNKK